MRDYRKLEVWMLEWEINKKVYGVILGFPKREMLALTDQMRRASISVISNIAEEYSRDSNKEFIHYLRIALGSVKELECQFYVALDVGYIEKEEFNWIMEGLDKLSKKSWKFVYYLKNKEVVA